VYKGPKVAEYRYKSDSIIRVLSAICL